MRIVHDVNTPMQVGGGGSAYSVGPGKQGFSSSQVEIVICESPAANHPDLPEQMFGDDEAIYIEGDTKYLIPMLEQALDMLRCVDRVSREKYGEIRSTNCPDGCADIGKFNGIHEITCPRHVNYEHFRNEAKTESVDPANGTAESTTEPAGGDVKDAASQGEREEADVI